MARGTGGQQAKGLASKIGTGTVLTVLSALVLPIWLLAFGAWIVQTVALALIEHQQPERHFLMFDWFVTAFEFVALSLLPFHLLARRSSPGIAALLGVVTVLTILRTNVWNDARYGGGFLQVDSVTNPGLVATKRRIETLFAGYLLTSFFNLLLLLAFGNLPAASAQDAEFIEHKTRVAAEEHGSHKNGVPEYGNGTGPRPDVENGGRQPTTNNGPPTTGPTHTGGVPPKPNFDDYPRTHHDTPTHQADSYNPVPNPPTTASGRY